MSVDFNYPYIISAATPAVADEVQSNFDQLLQWLKVNYRQVDDTPQMTVQLRLPGEPSVDSEAANKGYVDRIIPPGVISAFGGTVAPDGYALCDGSLQSTTDEDFQTLFGVIGYAYGGSGGSFNLPDLRDRVAVGVGTVSSVGDTGGVADQKVMLHTHEATHTHTASSGSDSHSHSSGQYVSNNTKTHTHSTPNHTHSAELAVYAVASRTLDGGGGTSVSLGQETGGVWTGVGVRQSNTSGGGTTGNASTSHGHVLSGSINSDSHSHSVSVVEAAVVTTESGTDLPATNDNYPPFVVVNHIIKL